MTNNKDLMERMADFDSLIDHEDNCGMCHHQYLMAQVAREMVAKEEYDLDGWEKEVRKRWEEGKYFQLWKTEHDAGRDPHKAFEERGWEA